MDKWLVRTDKNQISGPFSREQIRQMIQTGQLGIHDEVCSSESYWIYLHERDEVKNQLDVIVMYSPKDDGETTETDTEVAQMIAKSEAPPETDDFIDVSQAVDEDTAIMSNRALRQFRPKRAGDTSVPAAASMAPQASGPALNPDFPDLKPAQAVVQLQAKAQPPQQQTREMEEAAQTEVAGVPISSVPVPDGRPGFLQNFIFALILLMGLLLVIVIWLLKTRGTPA